MTSYDATIDTFCSPEVNSTIKKFGKEFKFIIAPRNVTLKPKAMCACTTIDWPIEKIKEIKIISSEYAKPSLYIAVATDMPEPSTFKFFLGGDDAAPGECLAAIDENIAAMGAMILASPAWTPFVGAKPAEPAPVVNGEGEVEAPATMEKKITFKVSTDSFSTVTDSMGLDKLGSDLMLAVYPREIVFQSKKMCGGTLAYNIEEIKAMEMLTAEFSEPSLLLVCTRDEQDVTHKLWVDGGESAILSFISAANERIQAMCTHLSSSPAWYRLAPSKAVPTKSSRLSLR